jgi:putative FmdB family regulatory protein
VPTYSYRCADCGAFDVRCAIAERTREQHCPQCGRPATRLITAPALRGLAGAVRGALEASERSADAPEVVTSLPRSRRATPITTDPRHLMLPRP